MKQNKFIVTTALVLLSCGISTAQSVNLWRGSEVKANWSDDYKWRLRHIPSNNEAVHFRQPNSVVVIDQTIDLNNNMMLYGQQLSFLGNGNINFWSPVETLSTIYIPASASGYANLTLHDTVSIKGGVALAAKAFGTAASKGTITLRDRSTIKGKLLIGNDGNGTGQVFVYDQAVYTVSDLDLQTEANKGGSAELHILGGTVHFENGTSPLEIFLGDPSRKIIMGEGGALNIQSSASIEKKKELLIQMLKNRSLRVMPNCKFRLPVFQGSMLLLKAERTDAPEQVSTLIEKIKNIQAVTDVPNSEMDGTNSAKEKGGLNAGSLAGYIAFSGILLLLLRPVPRRTHA
jgi:hypothetical protein